MSETKLSLRQILFTSVITLVFTIVAGYITYLLTNKQPNLSYSITSSPTLPTQGIFRRIFSLEVVNSGRKEVVNASAIIQIKNGKIEEIAYENSPGLIITEDRQSNSYLIKAATLNPKEKISVSVFATVPTSDFTPLIAVRGKGITGSLKKESENNSKKEIVYILVGSIAALLGIITSISPLTRKLIGTTSFPRIASAFLRSRNNVGPFERNELVAYILGSCLLKELSLMIRFAPSEITFRGAADFIASESLTADENNIQNYAMALKCMLLIEKINQESVNIIAAALKKISGTTDSEIKTLRDDAIDDDIAALALREKIIGLIESTDILTHS